MQRDRLCAVIAVAALALGYSDPAAGTMLRKGIMGGAIRGTVNLAGGHGVRCDIAVPDSFIVLDVKFCSDRVVVAACVENEEPQYYVNRFLSEIWMFAPGDSTDEVIDFADRRVLLSRASEYGESQTTYAYSINGTDATAVYDAGWEWSNVRLFDKTGRALPEIQDVVAQACGCNPEYTHPIAWLEVNRRSSLLLAITDGGLGPYLVRYYPDTGEATGMGADEIDADLLSQIVYAVAGQRW